MSDPIVSQEQIDRLKEAGWQLVPIEPDMNMKKASVDALKHYDHVAQTWDVSGWHAVWPAMLKVSPNYLA